MTVPAAFNEPITFIQRVAEYMEYVDLIHKAADTTDAVKRLQVSIIYYVNY